MDFLKKHVFTKQNIDWFYIVLIIAICWIFGQNYLFTKVGFPAICAMFGIAVVLSFFLRHILDEEDNEPEEGEDQLT